MLKGFFGKWKKKDDEEVLNEQKAVGHEEETEEVKDEPTEEIAEAVGLEDETESEMSDVEESVEEISEEKTEENEWSESESEELLEEQIEETVVYEEDTEEVLEESAEEEIKSAPEEEGKGFFARLKAGLNKTRTAISGTIDNVLSSFRNVDEELFEELEEALIMADIGVDTSLYIIEELRKRAKEQSISEAQQLKSVLKEIITEILINQDSKIDTSKKPTVIMVIGVNGVGKTTSIGKMAAKYSREGKKVVLAAADTFRAAAIDQLAIWAERAGVDIVRHQEGSDPPAVVFDAIAAAKARNADIVICDTAGRLHNKKNLMDELKKTARVIERETGHSDNEVLLVLDGSTGQNALIQAREFAAVADITGAILTKLDGTAKGGVVIALSREQNIGVKLIGVGEGIDDLQSFNPHDFAEALFPENE
ncbi:MAG: signal recognition particle-docking protein FtsY [Clostridia bacterium]|nr:signal recognition particle-docking protein FtsY [Clostridia bacterium]